jgi:short-subunit dehydrogenase
MNSRLLDWRGRRVWILGASSGIGAALARELAGRGARLALSARRPDELARLAAELPDAIALPCDAARPTSIEGVAAQIVEKWQGIDLALYAAGVWHPVAAAEIDAARIDATLDVNLRGAMHFAATVVPRLLAQGHGAIAFVGSVAGYRPLPRAALYGTSKAALAHFAGTLHLELAPRGIEVFLINPGFVATPMTAANDFPMPAMIDADAAAREIVAGLGRRRFEIHFPRRLSWPLKLLSLLPDALYYPLVRHFTGVPHAKA